jgi:hypothetical protein
MYCAHCGALNNDASTACSSCGRALLRAGVVVFPAGTRAEPTKTYLAQSIIVTVLCCIPAGVPAIVYSSLAMTRNSEGRYDEAHAYSRKASMWGWIAFGVGLALQAVYLTMIMLNPPSTP